MKYIKIILVALFPLFLIVVLEAVTTFLLLSFTNLPSQEIAFITTVCRVIVAIYLIYFLYKKQSIKIGIIKNNRFNVFLVLGCIAFSFIEIVIVYLSSGNDSQFLVAGKYNELKIISGLFIASWTEEVIFRGWLLNYLREKRVHVIIALFISSSLFGYWHYNVMNMESWRLIVLHFFTGLFLGFIFLYTGNILYSALAHFLMSLTIYSVSIFSIPATYSYPILIVSVIYLFFFIYRFMHRSARLLLF